MGKVRDIKGQKFNRLTAIEYIGLNKNNKALWKCQCECGNEVTVISAHLINGNTKSCGCYNMDKIMERNTTHGGRETRLYNIWCAMKERCYTKTFRLYKWYGAKGVTICDEWRNDFAAFREWAINNGYEETLTIERNEISKGYEPSNCRWITRKEQARNKSTTAWVTLDGVTKSMIEWSEILGVDYKLVRSRHTEGKRGYELFKPKAV